MSTALTRKSLPFQRVIRATQRCMISSHVPVHLRDEISHVFDIYKELDMLGKATDIRGWQDRAAAEQAIAEATERGATGI